MPLPNPISGERKGEFISRCMGDGVMLAEFPDQPQRAAVCNQRWFSMISDNIQSIKALASFKRYEKWQGEDYLILPAILLTEGVYNDLYYSPEQLAKYPGAWNGRPIPLYHPEADGSPVSCNSPTILPNSVGFVFNTVYEDGKLKAELWLNKTKLRQFDPNTLRDLETGKPVEISTGLWSDEIGNPGSWNNKSYQASVSDIKPDHVALLPGATGACSWQDGCGVPRLNQAQEGGTMSVNQEPEPTNVQDPVVNQESVDPVVNQEPVVPVVNQEPTDPAPVSVQAEPKKSVWERLREWFKVNEVECEDQQRLMQALEAIENNNVLTTNGGNDMSVKDLVNVLIEDKDTDYDEEDREWLEALSEARLKKMGKKVVPKTNEPEPVEEPVTNVASGPEPEPKVNGPKALTMEELLSSQEFAKAMVTTVKTLMGQEKKSELAQQVKKIKGLALTDEEIKGMSETTLEKLIKANSTANYAGRGADTGRTVEREVAPEPPSILTAKIDKEVKQ